MNKLKNWWIRRRRARALRKIDKLRRFVEPLGTVRQFLYLDSVALRSLYISRYGPEDARITITRSRSHDVEGSIGANLSVPGAGSGNAASTLRSSASQSMQIERVSSEQSLFRDFLDREKALGKDSRLWQGVPVQDDHIANRSQTLRRGDLIEIRVRLEADLMYRLSSFASATAAMADGAPDYPFPGATQLLQFGNVFRRLLIEQAPIDSELVDWGWDPAAKELALRSDATEPLRLVALTQIDNYWLDIRRALYDRAECTALVRVSQDVPSAHWTPVKLFDAVRNVPGLEQLNDGIDRLTVGLNSGAASSNAHADQLFEAFSEYAKATASGDIDSLATQIKMVVESTLPKLPSVAAMAETFDGIDRWIDALASPRIDADVRAELRERNLVAAGLEPDGASSIATATQSGPTKRYLIGEVVALYW